MKMKTKRGLAKLLFGLAGAIFLNIVLAVGLVIGKLLSLNNLVLLILCIGLIVLSAYIAQWTLFPIMIKLIFKLLKIHQEVHDQK